MKERLTRQLHPDVHQALRMAQRLTGREPVIKRVPSLPLDTRARLIRPKFPTRPYEIQYARAQERVLDHLIVHEVGHIVRLHQVPEAERLMPAITQDTRRMVVQQIQGELATLLARGGSREDAS